MTLVFTICSINYLAQAKALGDSLQNTHPDFEFVIGLVDSLEGKNKDFLPNYTFLPVSDIEIDGFDLMQEKYNITELNTAVKPSYFLHFFKQNPRLERIIYLDPDIVLFDRMAEVERALDTHNMVLTPHYWTPIPSDKFSLQENDLINYGIYNLGFLALKRSAETIRFLDWWKEKLKTQCVYDLANGIFVDQLWCTVCHLYFEGVYILKHYGYNVAYWNLHERAISEKQNKYWINDKYPLVFFHFSGFNHAIPNNISTKQNRFDLLKRPDLKELFDSYAQTLLDNHDKELRKIACSYVKPPAKQPSFMFARKLLAYPFVILHKLSKNMIDGIFTA